MVTSLRCASAGPHGSRGAVVLALLVVRAVAHHLGAGLDRLPVHGVLALTLAVLARVLGSAH